jgi:hypothetical protein
MTPRLPQRSTPPPAPRNAGTILALMFVVIICGGLAGLVSLVLPQAGFVFLVLAGFCLFVALHYFTWGRWLMRIQAEEQRAADERESRGGF